MLYCKHLSYDVSNQFFNLVSCPKDVADGTRGEVQNILQKLEDDKTITPESDSLENGQSESEVETQCSEEQSTDHSQNAANHQVCNSNFLFQLSLLMKFQ